MVRALARGARVVHAAARDDRARVHALRPRPPAAAARARGRAVERDGWTRSHMAPPERGSHGRRAGAGRSAAPVSLNDAAARPGVDVIYETEGRLHLVPA